MDMCVVFVMLNRVMPRIWYEVIAPPFWRPILERNGKFPSQLRNRKTLVTEETFCYTYHRAKLTLDMFINCDS